MVRPHPVAVNKPDSEPNPFPRARPPSSRSARAATPPTTTAPAAAPSTAAPSPTRTHPPPRRPRDPLHGQRRPQHQRIAVLPLCTVQTASTASTPPSVRWSTATASSRRSSPAVPAAEIPPPTSSSVTAASAPPPARVKVRLLAAAGVKARAEDTTLPGRGHGRWRPPLRSRRCRA